MNKDFLSIADAGTELEDWIDAAIALKREYKEGRAGTPLAGKAMGMIFEKPSLRTRVSFELGMHQLGGHALYLSPNEIQVGKREAVKDVANVMSRFVDVIMYRAFSNDIMVELAGHAPVPVINALDDLEHPCQAMADLMTVKEWKGRLGGLKLAWIGDGNNVCNSLLLACAYTGMHMVAAVPEGLEPDQGILAKANEVAAASGGSINIIGDLREAVVDADIIATDTWVSMGEESGRDEKLRAFDGFTVNDDLTSLAKDDFMFIHCLPAHRGEEVTDEVIDSSHSAILDEAENRLHAQKEIIRRLLLK